MQCKNLAQKQHFTSAGLVLRPSLSNQNAMTEFSPRQQTALQLIKLIDLTSLNQDDTETSMLALCQQSNTPFAQVAALCVYPQFIPYCKQQLRELKHEVIRLATVVNFPQGQQSVDAVCQMTAQALDAGADEIDLVFPYHAFLSGDQQHAINMLKAVKALCHGKVLKVILESGMIADDVTLKTMCQLSLDNGADFLKTSTGKVAVNATPAAARIMLESIRDGGYQCGFKAAGGIRNLDEARVYLELCREILGDQAIHPTRLRFGASSLLQNLLNELAHPAAPEPINANGY